MKIGFQRNIDRVLGTILCAGFSLWHFMRRKPPARGKPEKILVILLSEMGSLVLARSMFRRMKKDYPDASMHILLFEKNRELLEVLNLVPKKNIHTVNGDSFVKFIKDSLRVLVRLRKIKIDAVVDCELFSRVSSIFSFLSGARIRAGFHAYTQEGLFRGNFIDRPVLYNPYQHISDQFITLVEALVSLGTPTVKRQVSNKHPILPQLEIPDDQIKDYLKRFESDYPQVKGEKLVLMYPSGGLLPIRAWPLKHFCLVAEDLIQKGYAVGVIGMKNDKHYADSILAYCRHGNCIDLTGYTKTVTELMILFHTAKLLITNDGGPGHIASLSPIPSIVFFGPETPILYGILDSKSVAYYNTLSCSPCLSAYNHRNSPCDGDNVCLKSIEPGDVLSRAYGILETRNQ